MKTTLLKHVVVFALTCSYGFTCCGTTVSETEAVALAEWWYAAEINASTTQLPAAEKSTRVAAKGNHTVSYVLGRDRLQSTRAVSDPVAAYVVLFQPQGAVVVAGEDTIQPVLVFNATGWFTWDGDPKTNYFRYFLGRCVAEAVAAERALRVKHATHRNWTQFRALLRDGATQPAPAGGADTAKEKYGTYVLLPTALWNQGHHYNNMCVAQNGGNNVPTGCVATALAIKFRFHQWPVVGYGSHSYSDTSGSIQYSHSVNYGAQLFNWADMPVDSLTADNVDVSSLMYDCGVAVETNYEVGASGAWPYGADPAPAINTYFRYRGTYVINSRTTSDHTQGMSYCIRCGVPVVVGTDDHCFVACGYRDTVAPYFYFNMGWDGGNNGWYDVNDVVPDSHLPLNGSLPYAVPSNYAYADASTASGGNGDLQTPYQTVSAGQTGVANGGVLVLLSGTYHGAGNTAMTLSKPMTVTSCLGPATVGGN